MAVHQQVCRHRLSECGAAVSNPFDFWEESLPAHEKLVLAGEDRGEKSREVIGQPLTEDDADGFARYLGTD